jgi:hypothetical protein
MKGVLAVLDACANENLQICCGNSVGGGIDENGRGEPPSCCGRPITSDDLIEARATVAELLESAQRVTAAFRSLGEMRGVIPSVQRQHECEAAMLALDAAVKKATQP